MTVDVLARITPEMAAVLAKQKELASDAFDTSAGFDELRKNYVKERAFWNEGGPVPAKTIDTTVPGPEGQIPVRVHIPVESPTPLPAIVYIHGGGFVVGNLDTHDRIMRAIADASGAVVVGVDYTLSPEARFPQAITECAAVATFIAEHGAEWGIDPTSISFAGDSGGATLSMATTLWLRDHGGPAATSLLLYYGMFGLKDSASRRLFGGEWDGLTKADLEYYATCYVNDPSEMDSPYIDNLSADLSTLPPCYVVAAELDPLIDDSAALAAILADHGIDHEYRVFDGVLHAFLHHSRMLPEAREAIAGGAAFHRRITRR